MHLRLLLSKVCTRAVSKVFYSCITPLEVLGLLVVEDLNPLPVDFEFGVADLVDRRIEGT